MAGVITTPTLRPDGAILDQPGYDPATQLWYAPDSYLSMPALNAEPTREEALQALALYDALLVNFPFVSEVDRSVALSAVLTTLLRGAFDVAPMFLFVAHDFGSGKSYLVDLISTMARGRDCPVITNVGSEEMEKRLGALVLAGVPMISLDNCSGDIGGDLLCQITERRVINIRILGKSEAPQCEWRGVMCATGNNITLYGDMTRRGLVANLDPKVERAELRIFDFDPISSVLADRGVYVAAAITIARAYIAAGRPAVECPALGSYGQWSQIVRAPLIWLGKADPVQAMNTLREADPGRNAVRELIAYWKEYLTIGIGYTASALCEIANRCEREIDIGPQSEFRELLLLQAGAWNGDINTKKVGNWLMAIRGQIYLDHRIELVKESTKHGHQYALMPVKGTAGLPDYISESR